jgi:hypothetical protein
MCPRHPESVRRLRLGLLAATLSLAVIGCGSTSVFPTSTGSPNAAGQGAPGGSGAPGTGSATLTWTPVTQNTDGTLLTNLAGYKIHYGASPGELNTVVVLADPQQTTSLVDNLTPGTWYFTVAAYTSSGVDGLPSNVAQKTIP